MSEGYTISKDLIEDKYIPSPDLVAEYQENCAKTSSSQPMVENIQVKTIYGDKSVKNNTLKPYQRIIPPKGVLIEEKEENILDNLKNLKIDATIPNMEQSLIHNEIQSLQAKNISLENRGDRKFENLGEWKRMRQKIMEAYDFGK